MGQHWLKKMASRRSSEGELQMRLTHTFNKSKPGRYCTWHRAQHAGRAQQTWLTITTGTDPETVKQCHALGTVWNDWCRHLWGSHTEAASYWRNVYTQTGSGTPGRIAMRVQSNAAQEGTETSHSRVHGRNGMTVPLQGTGQAGEPT